MTRRRSGECHHRAKLTSEQVRLIRCLVHSGAYSQKALAREPGMPPRSTIGAICRNTRRCSDGIYDPRIPNPAAEAFSARRTRQHTLKSPGDISIASLLTQWGATKNRITLADQPHGCRYDDPAPPEEAARAE